MDDLKKLTDHDKDILISFFTYRMDQELRGKLMNEHPQIYNRLVGETIVATINLTAPVGPSNEALAS